MRSGTAVSTQYAARSRRRRFAGAAWLLLATLPTACEIEEVSIPPTESRVALHAVLSASAPSQVVLLERTRNGTVLQFAPPFDLADPVVSDEGVAESRAFVRLTTPDGQTLVAREDDTVRDDRKGQGIYRFALPGSALARAGTYRLSIVTSTGGTIEAETTVPAGHAAAAATPRVFDRGRDTVELTWPASPGARSYLVRVETPYGPRAFFTDSTRVRLTGELRNADADGLPRVFIPGFPQAVTVSAVDANFYDWYRTSNDALSGRGLVSRVQGGLGVFGALVRLRYEELEVGAPQPEPAAGTFRFVGTDFERQTTPFWTLHLYVESRATRADQGDALSGRVEVRPRLGYTGCLQCGALGTVRDGRVTLAILGGWYASDTTEVLTGELHGDTLVARYRGLGGVARFVRAAPR